jgi:hypothetical protein
MMIEFQLCCIVVSLWLINNTLCAINKTLKEKL